MNYRTILITSFYVLFFNMRLMGAEVGIQDNINNEIGFIQDNKGRKWPVFQDKQDNIFFARLNNEKVKVTNYIPCITRKLSDYLYVLYHIDGHTIKMNEMVSSEKSLEEAPTIYK